MQWSSCEAILKKSHHTCGQTLLQGSNHWQLQGSQYIGGPHYKVPIIDSYEKNHIIHVGETLLQGSHHWQLQCSQYMWGTPLHGSHHWQLQSSHIQIILIMWGKPITRFLPLTVTRFPHSHHIIHGGTLLQGFYIPYKVWGTIRVMDSYKVPTVVCPCP